MEQQLSLFTPRRSPADDELLIPTPVQMRNCVASGWAYHGDGVFSRENDQHDDLGYFTRSGFTKI